MNRPIEDFILENVTNEVAVDKLFDKLNDMQAAVAYLLMLGFSQTEIAEHFELSRQRINQIVQQIRNVWRTQNENSK